MNRFNPKSRNALPRGTQEGRDFAQKSIAVIQTAILYIFLLEVNTGLYGSAAAGQRKCCACERLPICCKGILLYVAHESGKEEGKLWNVGDQHEDACDDDEVGPEEAEYALDLGPPHFDADEEGCADGRGDRADAEVEDHEDTEVDGADAKGLHNGKEDGGEDQAGRSHIHEGADDQKNDVDDQKDHVLVAC